MHIMPVFVLGCLGKCFEKKCIGNMEITPMEWPSSGSGDKECLLQQPSYYDKVAH
jgi:hypothetical protein